MISKGWRGDYKAYVHVLSFAAVYRVITKEITEIKHVLLSHGVT
jgi:hypothetical protein